MNYERQKKLYILSKIKLKNLYHLKNVHKQFSTTTNQIVWEKIFHLMWEAFQALRFG